jgi:hypothetical protein
MQFGNPAHDGEVPGGHRPRQIIDAAPAEPQRFRLPGQRQTVFAIDHRTGYDPRPETETACRFDEEDREIPAGAPAAVKGLGRRLSALLLPARPLYR